MKRIVVAALVLLAGCQSQEPLGAPDVVGTIDAVNMANDRINYIVLHTIETPSGYEKLQVNVTPKTEVRWYSTGEKIYSHQNVERGMRVRAYMSGGIVDGTLPAVAVKRLEIVARKR